MPYKKSYKKRPRRGGYRRHIRYGMSSIPYLIKGFKFLKSVINVEKKYIELQTTSVAPTSSGIVTYLSGLAQGDDQQTRDGISIKAKYINLRMSALVNASATATIARIILFVDNDNQGALPAVGDLLDQANVNSQLNQFNGRRFTVLYDRQLQLNQVDMKTWLPDPDGKGVYRKLNMHIKYRGSAAAITSAGENAVFLLTISNEISNVPSISFSSRIRFIDN